MSEGNELERAIGRLEGKMDSMVSAMTALSSSFESLEKGRLSRLEIAFATLQTETTVKSRTTSAWTSSLISIGISVASALIVYFIKQ